LTAILASNATGAKRLNTNPTRSDSLWMTRMGTGLVEARGRTRDPNPALHERKIMATNIATAATSATLIPDAVQAVGGREYTDEEVRRLVAALEEPFDAQEIKWRVTNTTKYRSRGQVIAYADPRAYTDRLNAIFTVRGWTHKYAVQIINNVERKTSSESQIVGKVVVTCEVSIYGLGTHSGIGEEWADNENAGTAAEAQAFKRACACFSLGRYLLEGGWVDLDNRKQPKSTPKLPDWALPKRRTTNRAGQKSANQNGHVPQNRAAAQDAGTLRARVQALSDKVGFSLSRSVLMAVAKVDTLEKVAADALGAVVNKLEDMLRVVERLRAAIAIVGEARYSELCQELNIASAHLDDIPDREALRKAVEILEAEAVRKTANVSPTSTGNGATGSSNAQASNPPTAKELGETRLALIREAHRVARLRKMKVAEVVNRAARGAFTYERIKQLTPDHIPALQQDWIISAMKTATDVLRKITS
jgi:hypothetical protein